MANHLLYHVPDLHLANVIVQAANAYPIDFDDCGFGYLAYDAASGSRPPPSATEHSGRILASEQRREG